MLLLNIKTNAYDLKKKTIIRKILSNYIEKNEVNSDREKRTLGLKNRNKMEQDLQGQEYECILKGLLTDLITPLIPRLPNNYLGSCFGHSLILLVCIPIYITESNAINIYPQRSSGN